MTQILQQAYKSTLSSNPTITSNVIHVSGVGVKTCWAVEYTWLHVLGLRFHFICHGIHYNGWGPLRRSAGQETLFLWSFLHSRLIFLPHKTSNILIIIVITFTMNCVVNCHTKGHLAECGGRIVSLSYDKYEDQGCGTVSTEYSSWLCHNTAMNSVKGCKDEPEQASSLIGPITINCTLLTRRDTVMTRDKGGSEKQDLRHEAWAAVRWHPEWAPARELSHLQGSRALSLISLNINWNIAMWMCHDENWCHHSYSNQ